MPEPQVCTFGAPAAHATGRVALVGDSHALHWRAALDVTARAQGWQAFSITRAGCMFFAGSQALPEPLRVPCMTWNQSVLAWFRDHPEVSTVFVSQAAVNPVVAAPGKTRLESTITGFQRAWRALPNSVEHIIVIRDTPNSTPATLHCVRRVVRAGNRRPGPACRLRRYVATRRDAAIIAAKRLRSPRFQVVGLNEFFCSRRYCYPVIGGVLVDRDGGGHITVAYSRTLGPYLLRKVRRLTAFW